jgi:hypothetical protein
MWKEAVVAYFKILFRQFPGGTEGNHQKSYDIRSVGWDLDPEPPTYEPGVLAIRHLRSVNEGIDNILDYGYHLYNMVFSVQITKGSDN